MTYEEKRSWIRLVVVVVAYAGYVTGVIGGVPYAQALIVSALAAVVVAGSAEGVLAGRTSEVERGGDERDREIGRLGDHVGQAFVVIGALAGMILAMTETDPFWIANVIYLGFALSAIIGGAAKVVVYRTGVPQW
ncbi:hypothetical protein [Actinoplanes sp. OR16]|uniref:hypothetical protein n=1 Tax=Actinoplanes sp. OR16 TaxID=946334 RepID=UPI000FDC8C3E|nr:hypothetical protein [Actinoplanes sp. OR16]